MSTSRHLIDSAIAQLERIRDEQGENIEAAARRFADTIEADGLVHVFGSGHSSAVAQDLFGRAGGFTAVNWIHADDLMAVRGLRSGTIEQVAGLAAALLEHEPIEPRDMLIVISQSGRNAVPVEMAEIARQRGAWVVAITSLEHSRAVASRAPSGRRLFDVADLVLDNHAAAGDARIDIPFADDVIRTGPTSTIAGATIVQAIAAEAAFVLSERGVRPRLLQSGNQDGNASANDVVLAETAPRSPSLLASDISRLRATGR